MPNGGTDNCGNCPHNKRNQISPNPKTAQQATRLHFCTVHDIPLSDAYWTYCDNIYTTTPDRQIPINTIGIRSEGYARVAWLGRTAPQEVSNISACVVCGTEAKGRDGLRIIIPRLEIDAIACCNEHYSTWLRETSARIPFDSLYDIGRNELHAAVLASDHQHADFSDPQIVNCLDDFGLSPLHLSAYFSDNFFVTRLLESGADATLEDKAGRRAITLAGSEGHGDIVRVLIKHSFPDESTIEEALLGAATEGNLELVEALLKLGTCIDCTDYRGRTPLYLAVWGEHYTTAVFLLDQGADIHVTDDYGNTLESTVMTWNSKRGSEMKVLIQKWLGRNS